MTLHIDFPPQTEDWINAEARQRGLLPVDVVRRVVAERVATSSNYSTPAITAENAAAIAYLDNKLKNDATDDVDEIRRANEEFEELMRNLNANRTATGERSVFP